MFFYFDEVVCATTPLPLVFKKWIYEEYKKFTYDIVCFQALIV